MEREMEREIKSLLNMVTEWRYARLYAFAMSQEFKRET